MLRFSNPGALERWLRRAPHGQAIMRRLVGEATHALGMDHEHAIQGWKERCLEAERLSVEPLPLLVFIRPDGFELFGDHRRLAVHRFSVPPDSSEETDAVAKFARKLWLACGSLERETWSSVVDEMNHANWWGWKPATPENLYLRTTNLGVGK